MSKQTQLVEFLKQELSIPSEAIALGLRQSGTAQNLLPIVLWQYGFVTIHQLSEIYDWLEGSIH